MILPRTEPITVLVIDDGAPARERLVDLLRKEPMAALASRRAPRAITLRTIETAIQ